MTSRLEIDLAEGWVEYREALELLEQSDWSRALVLLAEAETIFRTHEDTHGLWRALIGQALLHWRDGLAPLAIARAMAAMRSAEAADDGYAVGCVAWQLANMLLGQGEYSRAADFFDQAQLALDAVGMAPPGGVLAAAARLCGEIARWQLMCERKQVGPREADAAIADIQQDLMARLKQAAASARGLPAMAPESAHESSFLKPETPPMLAPPETAGPNTGLGSWLSRLWRRLIQTADLSAVEGLTHAPIVPVLDAPEAARSIEEPRPETDAGARAGAEPEPPSRREPELPADPIAAILPEAPPTERPLAEPAPAPAAQSDSTVAAPPAAPAQAAAPNPAERADAPPLESPKVAEEPTLAVQLLGPFKVLLNGQPVESWPSGRGRAVFKYLLAHRERPMPRDVLMEVFWPDASPESARNSLNVALHGLRQALRAVADIPVVIFQNGAYRLNPELRVSIDLEDFKRAVQAGRRHEDNADLAAAIAKYERAAALYQGDFMADDLYDNWPALTRERLRVAYLDTLDRLSHIYFGQGEYATCISLCQLILAHDGCREDAHCHLIRCYSRQGQHHLAIRQYQACVEALRQELGVDPAPTTVQLYERARRHEQV